MTANNPEFDAVAGFDERLSALQETYEALLERANQPADETNGLFVRYRYPVLTADLFFKPVVIGQKSYDRSEAHLELSRNFMNISANLFARQLTLTAGFEFSPIDKGTIRFTARDFDYPFAARRLFDLPVEAGRLSGEGHLDIPLWKPERATGRASVQAEAHPDATHTPDPTPSPPPSSPPIAPPRHDA